MEICRIPCKHHNSCTWYVGNRTAGVRHGVAFPERTWNEYLCEGTNVTACNERLSVIICAGNQQNDMRDEISEV
ncbi:MAG: hypothetical protein LBS02_04295 [Hungatella sp.]|nr:hypothetical protein [Hungatella sp.]